MVGLQHGWRRKTGQSAYEYAELTDLADALFLPIEE